MMLSLKQIKMLGKIADLFLDSNIAPETDAVFDINDKGDHIDIVTEADFEIIGVLDWDSEIGIWRYKGAATLTYERAILTIKEQQVK